MKSFAVLALGLVAVNAQLGSLPQCAIACAEKLLTGGTVGSCGSDAKCICSNEAFIQDISCCVSQPGGCGADDQAKAVTFASQICAAQGITVPSQAICNKSNATTTAGATTSAANTSAANTAAAATTTPAGAAPVKTVAPIVGLLGGLAAAVMLL